LKTGVSSELEVISNGKCLPEFSDSSLPEKKLKKIWRRRASGNRTDQTEMGRLAEDDQGAHQGSHTYMMSIFSK
jgi:hypothetical protein